MDISVGFSDGQLFGIAKSRNFTGSRKVASLFWEAANLSGSRKIRCLVIREGYRNVPKILRIYQIAHFDQSEQRLLTLWT